MSTYYVNFAQWYSYEVEANSPRKQLNLPKMNFWTM